MNNNFSEYFKPCNFFAQAYFLALLFFAAGFFFLQSSKQLNNLFYIAIALPAAGICLFSKKRAILANSYFKLLLLLSAWVVLTGLLNLESWPDYLEETKPLLYIFLCSVAVFLISRDKPNLPLTFMYTLLITAALTGLVLLYNFYEPRDWNVLRRLRGTGAVSNPIWVGAIYGLATLSATLLFLYKTGTRHRLMIALLGTLSFVVLLASQSRGPLLALLISMVYAFVVFRKKKVWLPLSLALAGLLVIGLGYNQIKEHTRILNGDQYRTSIWLNAVDEIRSAPLLGHGIEKDTTNKVNNKAFEHFHNTYLTLAYHSGLVGLALFGLLSLRPFFATDSPFGHLLKPMILFGLVYMLFNGSRLFSSPKELWLIFWLPLMMLWASLQTRHSTRRSETSV